MSHEQGARGPDDAHVTRCLDCGAPVTGRYCSACGQEARHPEPPAGHLLREMTADAVGADSSTWRTFRLLLARPGELTVRYLDGQRTRFLPPLRLYLLASVAFVALAVSTPAGQSVVQVQPPVEFGPGTGAFRESFFDVWPWFLVALLPAFAAVYAVVLAGMRASFTRHVVFTLHLHAFGFASASLGLLLWYVPPEVVGRILAAAALFAPIPYLALALRRVHGLSWAASVAALVAVCFLDALLVAASSWLAYLFVVRLA